MEALRFLLTEDYGEKETLAALEELPMEVGFQSEPSYDVVEERKWRHWMHPPVES